MIPRIIIQTSANAQADLRLSELILNQLGTGWSYKYFSDADILRFFQTNPVAGLDNIRNKWHAMPSGAHRADLFRYYYLYVNGGVYLDSDAMIYADITPYCDQYDFFTTASGPTKVFNGFIGCCAKNPLMKQVLLDAYNVDTEALAQRYHLLCENINTIIRNYTGDQRVFLFEEHVKEEQGQGHVVDPIDKQASIAIHYYKDKIVP